jgi:hypothetical protein
MKGTRMFVNKNHSFRIGSDGKGKYQSTDNTKIAIKGETLIKE